MTRLIYNRCPKHGVDQIKFLHQFAEVTINHLIAAGFSRADALEAVEKRTSAGIGTDCDCDGLDSPKSWAASIALSN